MAFRTPMGRARGLGSAKSGVTHWWAQRLTGVALIPLAIWFVISVVSLVGADQAAVRAWMGAPLPAALMVLLIVATFHHAQLGLQVVIEDYVASEGLKILALILVKFAAALLGLIAIFAVLRAALGG